MYFTESRGMSHLREIRQELGATYLGGGKCQFVVWAPLAEEIEVHILAPREQVVSLEKGGRGYHYGALDGVEPGSLYMFRLDRKKERPDPVSRFQPQDVHGPSQVVDRDFAWEDHGWFGLPMQKYVLYEIHIGTFTLEGTFDAVISHLNDIKDLGITAIELMPVAQFPGGRNWGYDGVYPYAVQNSYGGPAGLKRLVNACHQNGLAVVLDVVYNHLGPEGNYLGDYGPYFTDRYRTPWGAAVNFDGPYSDEVRRFFIENALHWITEFHIDGLRLDAVHAIFDHSAYPFLKELTDAVHRRGRHLNRQVQVIAESDLNNARLILPSELGGFGMDAQWSDDLHHCVHTLLTGEQKGYYQDFGSVGQLASAFRSGYVYTGQFSPHRQRRHGNSTQLCGAEQFVVSSQNHDQVGNRMLGERLSQLVPFEALKLAAGLTIHSPFIPLLFMGEEYGETAQFPYFISHLDSELVEAVRKGRREEFSSFAWLGEPPDPQDEETFLGAKLKHNLRDQGHHKSLLDYYKQLITLRRSIPALDHLSKEDIEVFPYEKLRVLYLRRWNDRDEVVILSNLGGSEPSPVLPIPKGEWWKVLDSADKKWHGRGSTLPECLQSGGEVSLTLAPWTYAVFRRRGPH